MIKCVPKYVYIIKCVPKYVYIIKCVPKYVYIIKSKVHPRTSHEDPGGSRVIALHFL
jgi:hypothetical protein